MDPYLPAPPTIDTTGPYNVGEYEAKVKYPDGRRRGPNEYAVGSILTPLRGCRLSALFHCVVEILVLRRTLKALLHPKPGLSAVCWGRWSRGLCSVDLVANSTRGRMGVDARAYIGGVRSGVQRSIVGNVGFAKVPLPWDDSFDYRMTVLFSSGYLSSRSKWSSIMWNK